MSWVDHAIWWHVYPLGFCGAPIRPLHDPQDVFRSFEVDTQDEDADTHVLGHRLPQLLGWLDYLTDLGLNGLLLAPIFASSSHGYDTIDQFAIDPRLGDESDFDQLVAECRKRGIRLVLDGVFSHVGYFHPELQSVLAKGPDSPSGRLFDVDWESPKGPEPRVWEGHGGLVRLRHENQEAQDYVVDVMNHWLDKGIDGWRLDAAYSVPTSFWAQVLPRVRERHPDSWFLAEVIHGDYAEFVEESTADSVTQYQLWKAIWSSLKDANFYELDWSLQQHNKFLDTFVPNTFVGNHDVTRIATMLTADKAVMALAILMTVGGIPSIYYGDEQGFTGEKTDNITGDDAVRPPMPTSPSDLLPLGDSVNHAYRALIALRRKHPWLVAARTESIALENERYQYRVTEAEGTRVLEVTLELKSTPHVVIRDPQASSKDTVEWAQPAQ